MTALGPLITLTTDFGPDSPYVAAMKGVILSINPAARLVDLTHAVPPQDVRQGALALAATAPWFPAGSLHVAVIDPGVGTPRELLFAEIEGRNYLAPDNGLLSRLVEANAPTQLRWLRESSYWLPQVTDTFHGRDILAPVAAHLSLGVAPDLLGPAATHMTGLDWPEPRVEKAAIWGEILQVDSFGNLVTNIGREHLGGAELARLRVRCGPLMTIGLERTYGESAAGQAIALVGSSGLVELAIVGGNAARRYSLGVGAPVEVTW